MLSRESCRTTPELPCGGGSAACRPEGHTQNQTNQDQNLRIPQTGVCGVIMMCVLKCMMSREHPASRTRKTPPKCWQKRRTDIFHAPCLLETPHLLFISGPAEVIVSSTGLNWLSVYVKPPGPVNFLESLFGIGQSVHMCPFPLMHFTWGNKSPLGNKYYEITSSWTGADKHDWTKGELRQGEGFCVYWIVKYPLYVG